MRNLYLLKKQKPGVWRRLRVVGILGCSLLEVLCFMAALLVWCGAEWKMSSVLTCLGLSGGCAALGFFWIWMQEQLKNK